MSSPVFGDSIAYVYAEALYDVAVETKTVPETEQELLSIGAALAGDVKLRLFLDSPTISTEVKRTVLTKAMTGVSKPVLNLILLAIDHRRISMFQAIVDGFHRHANQKAGIAEVDVYSVIALGSAEQTKLKTMLESKLKQKVVLKEHLNPDLLGGLVLKHTDLSWDASIMHRLGRLVGRIEDAKVDMKLEMTE